MKTLLIATLLLVVGCEAIQDINKIPANTSSTVVDSIREQKEQAEEIEKLKKKIEDANL